MESSPQLIELSAVEADISTPSSLLSGQNNSGSTLSARRCLQRNGYKRTNYLFVATQGDMGVNTFSILHINILGGVVAERAFYSLCCLRI
ncbi:MAG: hypothetical protein E7147_03155 [Rikenellaceae bacterium]|nr:hypothetical protein [Rikenellaceae bacterium]